MYQTCNVNPDIYGSNSVGKSIVEAACPAPVASAVIGAAVNSAVVVIVGCTAKALAVPGISANCTDAPALKLSNTCCADNSNP